MRARVKDGIERYRKGTCRIRLSGPDGAPLAHRRVTVCQKTHDFKFGAHLFMLDGFEREEDDRAYRALFKEYFNLATVPFYWDTLEPQRGKPRFGKDSPRIYRRPAPDLCLAYCEQNGIEAKLHCLVYEKCIPDWLPKDDCGAMEEAYEKRIREIAARYAGRLREFEVINETLCESGWKTDSVVMDKRDVVEWAFSLARKYMSRKRSSSTNTIRCPRLSGRITAPPTSCK